MMTLAFIALGAYALITVLFVAGLAFAAARPVPELANVIEFPVQQTEEMLADEEIVIFKKVA